MAIMFSGSLRPDCSIAANIQEWAGWIESVLTTIGGWTVTSDTGQTLPSSLPAGTGSEQKLGYRIYQMNDDFTDDNPIYMRIDYGTSSDPAPYKPGIWFSFGTGTNGAGDLTGILWNGAGAQGDPSNPTIGTNYSTNSGDFVTHSYASADNSRFVLGLFVAGGGQCTLCFSLERSRDTTGAYTSDGLMICFTDVSAAGGGSITQTLAPSKYMVCSGGWQPPLEKSISWIYPTQSPSFLYGGAAPVALISHFNGFAQQPGINIGLTARGNISSEGQFLFNIYGQDHLYQTLGALWAARPIAFSGSVFNDAGIAVGIRYD